MSERISVALGGERDYDIHVDHGLLARAGEIVKPFARGTIPVVTDETVARLHLDALFVSLRSAGLVPVSIVLPPGERTKSFAELQNLIGALLKTGVDRGGLVVAFGGGVIGDLAGFATGIVKRGIDVVQIPTTLLAQVDSSVGGKTAINVPEGKNLVGMFHQPRCVVVDTALLASLPRRELVSGYAEVVKYGALGAAEFFGWLEKHGEDVLQGKPQAAVYAVAQSCRMKAEIVARDEFETGDRALLNLGHTFGHALEAATGYSQRLLHGEGIAIGMCLAFRLSERLNFCAAGSADRIKRHLAAVGLPTAISDISGNRPSAETLLSHMAHDKKVKDGAITFVLARAIGDAFATRDVPREEVIHLLSE
jgi:3-dehydroquinate synthase